MRSLYCTTRTASLNSLRIIDIGCALASSVWHSVSALTRTVNAYAKASGMSKNLKENLSAANVTCFTETVAVRQAADVIAIGLH